MESLGLYQPTVILSPTLCITYYVGCSYQVFFLR